MRSYLIRNWRRERATDKGARSRGAGGEEGGGVMGDGGGKKEYFMNFPVNCQMRSNCIKQKVQPIVGRNGGKK